ncbi:TIGR03086 family protein [Geodermatophilus sabuli]|uniref:TIGR03086 family protein n=1 Tax=Geodermatophilus sabuli TaxID=1564158 RepID=A0A7K3VYT8_9ACTN|nr:TIGR03086 family metal-binding protein [Geodermatophilus sabuli]NEK57064.1 TIGR03086 family protein [Geodermatophilus sabuli]
MQTTQLDLGPQVDVLKRVVAGVRDDQLGDPTPCTDSTVAALLDHVAGLAVGLRLSAEKTPDPNPPQASAGHLPPQWRTVIPAELDALVAAWRRPEAWEGETAAGGVTMPAAGIGLVTADEVLVHGWDLAVATGQRFEADPAAVAAATSFASEVAAGPVQPGLFGPPVPVPDDASPLDRLLGLTGRDPGWRPPG